MKTTFFFYLIGAIFALIAIVQFVEKNFFGISNYWKAGILFIVSVLFLVVGLLLRRRDI